MHPGRLAVLLFAWAAALRLGDAVATPRSGQAQTPPETATARAIGILEVPGLEKKSDNPIVLRRRASADSPIAATISSLEALEIEEFDSARSGALVFGREGDWSMLETSAGVPGWLAPSDSGTFHSLESLFRQKLTYLTDAWDGRVAATPGAARRTRLPSDPRKRMIGYLVSKPERPINDVVRDKWILAFERPDPFAAVVARFQSPRYDHVLRGTSAKTPPDIVVFNRQPGWFQVALSRPDWRTEPKVWIQDGQVWRFHEVTSEAERERLAEEAWGREHKDVRVVGFRQVAGALWLEVESLSHRSCTSSEPPRVKARGWIPAHAPSGEPTVWFAARGC